MEQATPVKKKSHFLKAIGKVLLTIFVFLLETVLLLSVVVYGVMYTVAKGPSPTASSLFVRSVRETSAIGFLADWFFTEDEIYAMEHPAKEDVFTQEIDYSLIHLPEPTEAAPGAELTPAADEWGFVDEDGDGIIIDEVKGSGYSGYMMIVKDPSRVIVGARPYEFGVTGYTVSGFARLYDAVAAVNAGGYEDIGGGGDGSIPNTMVIYDGEIYWGDMGCHMGFAGLDSNHILHVGDFTPEEAKELDLQYGVGFGPVLITNGVPSSEETLSSGLNPRTAIGQRSDGAILLLVIDGRQIASIGATYSDEAEIMLSYGAVNACNMDGGSSTLM